MQEAAISDVYGGGGKLDVRPYNPRLRLGLVAASG
jgi:hypothetical protein